MLPSEVHFVSLLIKMHQNQSQISKHALRIPWTHLVTMQDGKEQPRDLGESKLGAAQHAVFLYFSRSPSLQ